MPNRTLSDLALEVERLRFATLHGLPEDAGRLERLTRQLLQSAPHHPIALNLRAERALPETFLPAPDPQLTESATAFAAGELEGALESARSLSLGPEATGVQEAAIGDLLFLRDSTQAKTHYRAAIQSLGSLPPLLTRLGRCALAEGDPSTARRYAVRSLVENPLYGTALVLLWESSLAAGQTLLSIPIQARAIRVKEGIGLDPTLSPRARKAWEAWVRARAQLNLEERPPEKTATLQLIQAWRSASDEDLAYTDSPNQELEALDRWEQEGVLDAYLWFSGLDPESAPTFRQWREENRQLAERFWSAALVLS